MNKIEILTNYRTQIADAEGDLLISLKKLTDATLTYPSNIYIVATSKHMRKAKKLFGLDGDIKANAIALIDLMIDICKENNL
jgi:hypothetical protein